MPQVQGVQGWGIHPVGLVILRHSPCQTSRRCSVSTAVCQYLCLKIPTSVESWSFSFNKYPTKHETTTMKIRKMRNKYWTNECGNWTTMYSRYLDLVSSLASQTTDKRWHKAMTRIKKEMSSGSRGGLIPRLRRKQGKTIPMISMTRILLPLLDGFFSLWKATMNKERETPPRVLLNSWLLSSSKRKQEKKLSTMGMMLFSCCWLFGFVSFFVYYFHHAGRWNKPRSQQNPTQQIISRALPNVANVINRQARKILRIIFPLPLVAWRTPMKHLLSTPW